MSTTSFHFDNVLKLLKSVSLEHNLGLLTLHFSLEFVDPLVQRDFLILIVAQFSLKLSLIGLLIVGNSLKGVKLLVDLFSLRGQLIVLLGGVFELPGNVINVPFKSEDLLHIVLFLLLMVLNCH